MPSTDQAKERLPEFLWTVCWVVVNSLLSDSSSLVVLLLTDDRHWHAARLWTAQAFHDEAL